MSRRSKYHILLTHIARNYPQPTTAKELKELTGWSYERIGMFLHQWKFYFNKTRRQGNMHQLKNDVRWNDGECAWRIYNCLKSRKDALTIMELSDLTGCDYDVIQQVMNAHKDDLNIWKGGKTVYSLTELGVMAFREMGLIE